jgi:hypothetical protein
MMECLLYSRNFDDLKKKFVSITMQKKFEGTKEESEAINRRSDNTMAKKKKTYNDLQKIAEKTKDRATRTESNTGIP